MKLCINCQHGHAVFRGLWDRDSARCQHPDAMPVKVIDLVTGHDLPAQPPLCVEMRNEGQLCGPEGKLWQART